MAYTLDFAPHVRVYLRNLPGLSRQSRVKLFAAIDLHVRQLGDVHRMNHELRLPDDRYFQLGIAFRDESRRVRYFTVVVNDEAAEYGVLKIEYADEAGE